MKPQPRSLRRGVALATVLCLVVALPAAAETVKAAKQKKALPASPAETMTDTKTATAQDTAMAAMMKMAQPGPQHALLKTMEGRWKAVVKSWNGPGEPSVSEGTSDARMILGGRYLEETFQSTMMNAPFEGHGLTGYDNATQRYWFSWIDNMSTGMMSGTGSMDDAGKLLTVTATTTGPDGKPAEVRMVTKLVDANNRTFSMYGTMGGQEMLMMEITYTRM